MLPGQSLANSFPNSRQQQDPIRATDTRTRASEYLRYAAYFDVPVMRKVTTQSGRGLMVGARFTGRYHLLPEATGAFTSFAASHSNLIGWSWFGEDSAAGPRSHCGHENHRDEPREDIHPYRP